MCERSKPQSAASYSRDLGDLRAHGIRRTKSMMVPTADNPALAPGRDTITLPAGHKVDPARLNAW